MKILVVAATWMEVKLLTDELEFISEKNSSFKEFRLGDKRIDVLISGIGAIFTTFHLTQVLLQNEYDLVICAGIAGSLSSELKIGDVVNVVSEEFADLGIEDKTDFLTLFELGFLNKNDFPFLNGQLNAAKSDGWLKLKKVHGITVNKSHGNGESIKALNSKFSAQVESMEGAAVLYVCTQLNVPCHQIRAISNYVEPRDSSNWDIPLALENLKKSMLQTLQNCTVKVA